MVNFFDKIWTFFRPNRRQQGQTVQDPLIPTIPENGDGIDDALRLPSEDNTCQQSSDDTVSQEQNVGSIDDDIVMTEITPVEDSSPKESGVTEESDLPGTVCPSDEKGKSASVEKLIKLTVDTIRTYDMMSNQLPMGDQRTLIEDVCSSLVDNLIMAGCTPIGEESGTFNIAYHKTSPSQIVPDGTPYTKLLRKGIEYNGEVKLLAIVEL